MYNLYNLQANFSDKSINSFKEFLRAEKISSGSIRSYLSDVRHFLGWLTFFLKSNNILLDLNLTMKQSNKETIKETFFLLKHVNQKVLDAYKVYLVSNNTPFKTINRRFSSLRRFGVFCKSQNWTSSNPFDTLKNITLSQPFPEDKCHLAEFKTELWKKGASKVTIKNYLNDIKQFLFWSGKQR